MTQDDAQGLRDHLSSGLIAHRRADGTWIIVRVPSLPQIRAESVRADRGQPIDVRHDPRPANYRNIPPFGGGY